MKKPTMPVEAAPIKPSFQGWPVFFLLLALQGLAALIWLTLIPGDPKNSLLLGFSASRLVLMAGLLTFSAIFFAATWMGLKSRRFKVFLTELTRKESRGFPVACGILALLVAAGWGLIVGLRADPGEATYAVFERLLPFLALIWLASLEGLGWLVWKRYGLDFSNIISFRKPIISGLWILAGLIFLGTVLALTGFGIVPDEFFWGSPGVPLLAWQVAASALIALTFYFFSTVIHGKSGWKTDLVIFMVIWAGTYLIWMSQPVPRSYFTPTPRAPNFEIYPYSDAGFYDFVSQSLLTGNGFLNHQIVTRPIYAVILAGFHALVGQKYNSVVALQTVFLALFPALLYLLGKSLHSRPVGIMTAVLAVWRELNLIAATPLTEVSDSKMLMTDSLTGVAFAAWILWLIWWQKRRPGSLVTALGIGGFFGLMLLLRAQALVVLPVVLLIVLLNQRRRLRLGLATCGMLILGTILSFSPWLVRNYILTGQLAIDQPSQAALHATRFTLSTETMDESLTEKPPAEVSATVARFMIEHPLFTLQFMGAHFLNNEFSTLTVLPLRVDLIDARDNLYVDSLFWIDGVKNLSPGQLLLLGGNLIILAAGLAFSVWRYRWTGLIPLFVHLAYSASSAVARISGWRFVQPVDWVVYLYYSIGLACLVYLALVAAGLAKPVSQSVKADEGAVGIERIRWPAFAACGLALVLLGAITPAMEWLIPRRYPVESKALTIEKIAENPQILQQEGLADRILDMAGQKNSIALWGRSLYPRFYKENAGEPGSGWMAYKAGEYAKLGFVMITPSGDYQVVLPAETAPAVFPNASDVMLVGCNKDGLIEAAATLVVSSDNALYLSSQADAFQCQ